jgi:hypothetical protein
MYFNSNKLELKELNAATKAATQGSRAGGRMGSLASRSDVDFGCVLGRGWCMPALEESVGVTMES